MGGTRWGHARGDGQQSPPDLRKANLDGPTAGRHPKMRAVLARDPSIPPLSLAFSAAELRAVACEVHRVGGVQDTDRPGQLRPAHRRMMLRPARPPGRPAARASHHAERLHLAKLDRHVVASSPTR